MATDVTCLNCHNVCPNCLLDYQPGNENTFGFCSCEELQSAHVEETHNALVGHAPASFPCLEFLDDLIVNGELGFQLDATGPEHLSIPEEPCPEAALTEQVNKWLSVPKFMIIAKICKAV